MINLLCTVVVVPTEWEERAAVLGPAVLPQTLPEALVEIRRLQAMLLQRDHDLRQLVDADRLLAEAIVRIRQLETTVLMLRDVIADAADTIDPINPKSLQTRTRRTR